MNIQTNTHIHTNAKIKIHKLNIHKCKHLIKRHEYEYTCCISLMPRNKYKETNTRIKIQVQEQST